MDAQGGKNSICVKVSGIDTPLVEILCDAKKGRGALLKSFLVVNYLFQWLVVVIVVFKMKSILGTASTSINMVREE